jgi:hypothetical protein
MIETMSLHHHCRVCKADCDSCNAHCEYFGWCTDCSNERLVANFNNWTSSNREIDAFIQETQRNTDYGYRYLEWIDPQQITDIKHIADGGFGSVYQATWMNAPERFGYRIKDGKVALKTTNSDISTFLNEVNKRVFKYQTLMIIINQSLVV